MLKRWALAVGWMFVILYLSTLKVSANYGETAPSLVHFVEYGVLAMLVRMAFSKSLRLNPLPIDGLAIAWSAIYGAAMEGVQYFLPYRSADINDAIVNTLGAAFGILVLRAVYKFGRTA